MTDFEISATFWEHAAELRQTLLRTFLVIAAGVILALCFYPALFNILTLPLQNMHDIPVNDAVLKKQDVHRERITNQGAQPAIYTTHAQEETVVAYSLGAQLSGLNSYEIPPGGYLDIERVQSKENLVVFGPLEGMTATLKMCFWVGVTATCPIWMFFILTFVAPALDKHQKRYLLGFLITSIILFAIGVLLAFFITIPLANRYLLLFNKNIATNLWSLSHYMDYTIVLLLANGLAFELGALLLFLVHLGVFTAEAMIAKRRHMIVLAFILGAVLTPPDILTQLLLAIPLMALYEIAILYARLRQKKMNHFART